MDYSSNNDQNKSNIGQTIKSLWQRIPIALRIKIIIGLGVTVLLLIIILGIASMSPLNFLFYSDDIQNDNAEVDEAYEEYWNEFCKEDSDNCSEEQKKAAEKLKEDQTAFYERLDSLATSYLSTDAKEKKEQRYLILTTVFYGYDIDDLTNGSAFELDSTDEMTISEDTNVYKKERDTLKELVKQFKVTTAICYQDVTDENGNLTTETLFPLKNSDGEAFSFNFFEKIAVNMDTYTNEEYDKAKKKCYDAGGKVAVEELNGGKASTDAFYRYLEESDYLDDRSKLQHKSAYDEYAKSHGLAGQDVSSWPEEDKKNVRKRLVEEIKSIVQTKITTEEVNKGLVIAYNNAKYWWPIGSLQTETINGKKFATGNPYITYITSGTGWRKNPTGPGNQEHGGIDIAPPAASGVVPVIAAQSGTVAEVSPSISYEEFTPPGSYGNYVKIEHPDGNYTMYGHMYKNTITVKVGEEVQQGQVIGYVGSSGDSTGTHLHFELRVGGPGRDNRDDPLTKVDINDPRPVNIIQNVPLTSDENIEKIIAWVDCFEGTTPTINGQYMVEHGAADSAGILTVGHGIVLSSNAEYFSKYGIDVSTIKEGSYLPAEIVDAVRIDVVKYHNSQVKKKLANHNLVFDNDKISALTSFHYNTGGLGEIQSDGEEDFFHVYKDTLDTQGLYDDFFQWYRKSNGQIQPGLVKRRQDEFDLFHNHVWKCYNEEWNYVKNN